MFGDHPDKRDAAHLHPAAEGPLARGVLMTMHRLSQGGADRVAVLLANGFVAAGIPTHIALLRNGGEGERALLDLLDPAVGLSRAGPAMPTRHLDLLRGLSFVRRQIALLRPAVVLASSNNMGLVTGLSAGFGRRMGVRYMMKVTNPVVRPRDKGVVRTFYRHRLYDFILGQYDQVLSLSAAARTTLVELYPHYADKFHVTPNAYVHADMLADRPPADEIEHGHVLALARMMPQKRLDLLLRAFADVTCPGSRLTILGDGPERTKLTWLARALGVADRVDMPGFVEDVVPWLRRADLFALSSDYEGLPGAVIEALAHNVPVVTTDCFDGVRELLAGAERCAVVPRDNPAALARAIDASLADRTQPLELRERARKYTIEDAVQAHVAALRPLLA